MFEDEVLRPQAMVNGSLDVEELRRRTEAHRSARAGQGYQIWAVWVLERWLQSAKTSSQGMRGDQGAVTQSAGR
jgi:hypothetical protein